MALIGAVTLTGMIIKNGIVLMDQIELERANGRALVDAIKEATVNRTMAISMGGINNSPWNDSAAVRPIVRPNGSNHYRWLGSSDSIVIVHHAGTVSLGIQRKTTNNPH